MTNCCTMTKTFSAALARWPPQTRRLRTRKGRIEVCRAVSFTSTIAKEATRGRAQLRGKCALQLVDATHGTTNSIREAKNTCLRITINGTTSASADGPNDNLERKPQTPGVLPRGPQAGVEHLSHCIISEKRNRRFSRSTFWESIFR